MRRYDGVTHSGTNTAPSQVQKRDTWSSKFKSPLPFLCTSFKGQGKKYRDMITAVNRGQIEPISEIALNLLKGNII